MTARDLAVAGAALLGRIEGPVIVVAPRVPGLDPALRMRVAGAGDAAAAAMVVFLWEPADAIARSAVLKRLRDRLSVGAPVVVVDHNQPRRLWRRVLGAATLAARGVAPGRARYRVARELAAAGFTVERLRLLDGERVQCIRAVRA